MKRRGRRALAFKQDMPASRIQEQHALPKPIQRHQTREPEFRSVSPRSGKNDMIFVIRTGVKIHTKKADRRRTGEAASRPAFRAGGRVMFIRGGLKKNGTLTCDARRSMAAEEGRRGSQWRGFPRLQRPFLLPLDGGSVHTDGREKRNRNGAQGSGTNYEVQPQGVRKRRFSLPLLLLGFLRTTGGVLYSILLQRGRGRFDQGRAGAGRCAEGSAGSRDG
jgi:hypothetical protein